MHLIGSTVARRRLCTERRKEESILRSPPLAINYGQQGMKIDADSIVFGDRGSRVPDLFLGYEAVGNCANGNNGSGN